METQEIKEILDSKLASLQHPNPYSVNILDRLSIAKTIYWLEDKKIRFYHKDNRAGLGNLQDAKAWGKIYRQYKFDVGVPTFKTRAEELLWLVGYAIKLQIIGPCVNRKKNSKARNRTKANDLRPPIKKDGFITPSNFIPSDKHLSEKP